MRVVLAVILCIMVGAAQVTPVQAAKTSLFEITGTAKVSNVYGVQVLRTTTSTDVVGMILPGERVQIVGRVENGNTLRIQSSVGTGYVPKAILQLEGGVSHVPIVSGDLPPLALPAALPVDDSEKYPLLPRVSQFTKFIYQWGLELGNHPQKFTKIGDCMTADVHLFLGRFGHQKYWLADYEELEPVINYYNEITGEDNPFVAHSQAAQTGFNAASVEDSLWSDPAYCESGETPLACEYRLYKPGIALIMFGTNDVKTLTAQQFDFFLRLVVYDSIEQGVIPLLSTFPGDPYRVEDTHQFNQIIVRVAEDYDVPVMNLWLALQSLPDQGRNPNSMYLSQSATTDPSDFSPANLKYGYTTRNLLTLQALDILWRELIQTQS